MKILILKKKLLINSALYITLFFLTLILIYFISNKFESIQTISPINLTQDAQYDLNGDGKQDTLELLSSQNKVDFNISCSDNNYYLSNKVDDKILFTTNLHFQPKVFFHDLSRDNIPEIILLGFKNNKCVSYVFQWNKKDFNLAYSNNNNNIFGILDCKNSKTPQCYSLSSSEGISSLNSFMLINNDILDTSKDNTNLPSLDSTTNFINLVELPYVLDDLPDIFSPSLDRENLSLLWNLDKDNYSYSFQNAFFYDYEWNNSSEPSAIRWRLSFEKSSLRGANNKSELILLIDLEKYGTYYKITSIQKVK